MRRTIVRTLVAVLTFVVGLTGVWLLSHRAKPKPKAASESQSREWGKLLAKATKIVERVPRHQNRSGEWGERVVAVFPPDEYGGATARILWYDGGECYLYIRAPTLDIALEFERTNAYAY